MLHSVISRPNIDYMLHPPDDHSIIPQKRLGLLLQDFEHELQRVNTVFQQHLPGEFKLSKDLEKQFWSLRSCAESLGSDYSFLVEKLISDYEHFRDHPDHRLLDKIFKDVRGLQLLLTDYS